MASVYNRGTKQRPIYWARIKENGKWKGYATQQMTKEAARKVADEMQARVRRGELAIPDEKEQEAQRLTVADLCKRFMAEYRRPRIRNMDRYTSTYHGYIRHGILASSLADMEAAKVRKVDIERWRDGYLPTCYTPGSASNTVSLLSTIYNWCIAQEIIDCRNPAKGVEKPQAKPSEDHYSMEEARKLLSLPGLPPIIWTALYTGMRKGELFGLLWSCVKLDGDLPRIEVKRSYLGPTKGDKPRVIPIHPELLPTLRRWKEDCPSTEMGLVFPIQQRRAPRDWRMGRSNDMEGLPDLLRLAGVHIPVASLNPRASAGEQGDERCWHAFRHTFASHFMEASGNGDALSKLLGHSIGASGAAAVTMGYTHTSVAYLARELAKMTLLPPAPAGVLSLDQKRRERAAG